MSMIRWTPFRELENFFDDMDDMFLPVARRGAFAPAMDVYEDGDNLVAEVSIPGLDPKDVDVTVENGILTIQGQTKAESEKREKGYYRREVRAGAFRRAVQLPLAVEGDQAKAIYEHGLLKITIPKAEHAKAKKISVETRNDQSVVIDQANQDKQH
jgi:HSP20 family protein